MGLDRFGVCRVQFLRCDEACAALWVGLENAVDDADVKMGVLVQRGAEPMDEGHRAGSRLRSRAGAAAAQVLLDGIEEAAQGAVEGLVVVLEMVAQPFGQGQHPLTHRQAGQDMIGQVGGGLERGALVLLVSSTRYYPAQCNRLFNRATRHGPSGCFASQRQGWCARPGAPRKRADPFRGRPCWM